MYTNNLQQKSIMKSVESKRENSIVINALVWFQTKWHFNVTLLQQSASWRSGTPLQKYDTWLIKVNWNIYSLSI
jgi:hypothetical protein